MPKSNLFRVLVVPSLMAATIFTVGCNKDNTAAGPPAGGMMVPVTAVPASTADVPIYLDEIGKTVATQSVTVVPQVSGPIVNRYFKDGDDIKKGDPLFDIDPRPYQAQLDQAKGQLLKDQAQKSTAEWNVAQDTQAMATKAISEQQLHNDTGTRDQAIGSIAVDEAQIASANLNIEYCHIKSPIDGRAGQRLVDVGNVVTAAGQAPGTNLLSIQMLDPIYADFTVTEAELLKVQQYMAQGELSVQVESPQDVIAQGGAQPATQPSTLPPGAGQSSTDQHPAVIGVPSPDQTGSQSPAPTTMPMAVAGPRTGKLTFLDNAVQDGTGTVKLRATIPNADHHFWPGQFVNVRLVLKIQKDAVLIPNQAVQISQTGPFVFVVTADGTAQAHPVVQGQRQGELVVIESGVASGDQVVITGQTMLMPGGKVMVVNAPHPGAPAAGKAPAAMGSKDGSSKAEGSQS